MADQEATEPKKYYRIKSEFNLMEIKGDVIHGMSTVEVGDKLQLIKHPASSNYFVYELFNKFCPWYFEVEMVIRNPHIFEPIN